MNDRTAFILSLCIHLGLFTTLIVSTWSHFRMPQKYVPIELVPIEEEKPKPEPEQPPEPEPEKVEKKPKLSPEAIQMMKNRLKKLKTPTRTPVPTKKRKPTVPPTPKPKPTATRTPYPTLSATLIPLEEMSRTITPKPASAVTSASSYQISIEGDPDFDFSGYIGILNRLLQQAWRPPSVRPPEERDYVTIISFTIYRDGTISNIQMESSSGWMLLDQTVREAVKRASPLEPLPQTYSSGQIRVRVPFVLPINQ